MAEVVLATALQKQTWSTQVTREYVRRSRFLPYMGKDQSSIITVRDELKSTAGDTINFPLVATIKGRGVRGAEVLKGNEIDLGLANTAIKVDWLRQGVKVPKSTSFRTAIDIWGLVRPGLREWSANTLRDDLLNAMNSIIVPGTVDAQGLPGTDSQVLYPLATAAQRNTYLQNNLDRVLFGNLRANASSGNFATSLGNVSIASGKTGAAHIDALKALAESAGAAVPVTSTTNLTWSITPYQEDSEAGREWFVYFVGSREFRDLMADTSINTANLQARAREGNGMEKNPIFQGGDLMWNGVIIRKVPEIDNMTLVGAGASGADVVPGFFMGQSAIGVAYGMNPRIVEDLLEDYEFRPGMAIEELRGVAKTSFGGVQYGMVTSYVASPAFG
jgi:N4-gp56 family major capsid protein